MYCQKHTDAWSGSHVQRYTTGVRERFPIYDALHNIVLSSLEIELPQNARLFIVGCGPGEELVRAANSNPEWEIVGLDTSQDMVALAIHAIHEKHLEGRVSVVHGEVGRFSAADFDAASAVLVNQFIPDEPVGKIRFLSDIAAKLKSGAPFILGDVCGSYGDAETEKLFQIWKSEVLGHVEDKAGWSLRFDWARESMEIVPMERLVEIAYKAGFIEPTTSMSWLPLKVIQFKRA